MNRDIQIEPLDFKHAGAIQKLASDPAIGATSNVPSPYPADGVERGGAERRGYRSHDSITG